MQELKSLASSLLRWCGLVAANAIVCLLIVAGIARDGMACAAVAAALFCWALFYASIDWWLGRRGSSCWQARLRRAALMKILTQLLPVLEIVAGMTMLSMLGPLQLPNTLNLFFATLGTGALLSLAVGALMLIGAGGANLWR